MKRNKMFKKPATMLAVLAICFSLSVSAMAASGVLKGFFQDVTRPDGAVTGTIYEQASDEIAIRLTVDGDTLIADTYFTGTAPFQAEELKISGYQIVDGSGNVVKEGSDTEYARIIDGRAEIRIDLKDVDSGSYKLVVNSFTASKKADSPLIVNGSWNYNFTK